MYMLERLRLLNFYCLKIDIKKFCLFYFLFNFYIITHLKTIV